MKIKNKLSHVFLGSILFTLALPIFANSDVVSCSSYCINQKGEITTHLSESGVNAAEVLQSLQAKCKENKAMLAFKFERPDNILKTDFKFTAPTPANACANL